MDDLSIGSDPSDFGSELEFSWDSDFFVESDTATVHSSASDRTYSDMEFCAIQELLDHDLSDSSKLEDDEVARLLQEQADISPSKTPPRGGLFIDCDSIFSPVNVVRNLDQEFLQDDRQVDIDDQGSPKRKRPTTTIKGSIIHNEIKANNVIWVSFDIETRRPQVRYCSGVCHVL